ncbi:MAG: ferrous iron transport protein A [Deltaproteobacteria bacterium]|nr:ferrous iron transport protein A [Deltaproteobacteria bacterium]
MLPLAFLKEDEVAEIVESPHRYGYGHQYRHGAWKFRNGVDQLDCCRKRKHSDDHLLNIGLRPGKYVRMISNSGAGPLVLLIDECRIALGRGIAMKIYVRRIEA